MSYTDLRDFYPEYVYATQTLTYEVEKLGGGTLGRAYSGTWRYRVIDNNDGETLYQGQDLRTGMPKRHDEIPDILRDFLLDQILDSDELADILAMPDTEV